MNQPQRSAGLRNFAVILMFLALPSCVTMGKYHALKDRVLTTEQRQRKLEEDIATLANRLENLRNIAQKSNDEVRTDVANLDADYMQLQMALGSVQGRLEEVNFTLNSITKHVKGLKGLVEDRFGTDSEALPENLPTDAEAFYQLGVTSMNEGLVRRARAVFNAFIKKYPAHDRIDDAQFMLAETLFSEGRFTEAVTAYRTVYEQYPDGDKHPEAVMRIGLSYVRSNRCNKALKIYKFAKKTYKGTPVGDAAAAELEELKKVCK